jgi:capsular exopolysaccharide synthesis family protein
VSDLFDPAALLRTFQQDPKKDPKKRGRVERSASGDVDIEFPLARLTSTDAVPDLEVRADAGPRDGALARRLAEPLVEEEFRLLRAKVRALDAERPLRCIGIVSAGVGEGKSTMAVGLARAFAQETDGRCLLIECDLRRPVLDRYLELLKVPGLGEFLDSGTGPVGLRRIASCGFYLLSAGLMTEPRPPELLGSDRMARLLESARRSFDFIVVDCPPLLSVADAVVLQDLLDGFLMVVRARYAPSATVSRALSRLKPHMVRGVVLNDHNEMLPRAEEYAYRTTYLTRRED